jgi:hypothetical protein
MMLKYLQGGNPPHSPGIYEVGGHRARLIALWPAWVGATQPRVDNICRLIEAGREFQSRDEIDAELSEAGLL